MISAYLIHILILIAIYAIVAIALQLCLGFSGLLNLGHISFFGIGAYTSALLLLLGVPFIFCFLAAGIMAMIFGFILAIPTHKLKGDYLALATMGFSFVVYAVLLNWTELTRGPLGIPGIPKPSLFGFSFSSNFSFLILAAVIAVCSYFLIDRIVKSGFGKVFEELEMMNLQQEFLERIVLR